MPRWVLDESRRPLVVAHIDDVSSKVAPDFESLLQVLDRLKVLARETPCYVVIDLTGAQPDARKRQRFVSWIRKDGLEIRERMGAIAVVAPSTMLRGAFTAIQWFVPERVDRTEVFENRPAAIAWASAQMP